MKIDIWSDIACPWCYVGKRRLEKALDGFGEPVEITWRAFELDPGAPKERDPGKSQAARLAEKYGASLAQAEGMIERMTSVAKEDGLDFRFDRLRSGNTFDAHRVIHLGQVHRKQDAVKERLLAAYMTEGAAIGDHETLIRLGAEAGLAAEDVRAMLASDRFVAEVRADEAEAGRLGISGVPFFVFDGRLAISGAQPVEVFERALAMAQKERAKPEVVAQGTACGPNGCEIPVAASPETHP